MKAKKFADELMGVVLAGIEKDVKCVYAENTLGGYSDFSEVYIVIYEHSNLRTEDELYTCFEKMWDKYPEDITTPILMFMFKENQFKNIYKGFDDRFELIWQNGNCC